MTNPKSSVERLQALLDAIEENVFDANSDEFIEELEAEGNDAREVAARVRAVVQKQLAEHRRTKLEAARRGYEQAANRELHDRNTIPTSAEERRDLLGRYLMERINNGQLLSVAAREGKDKSVESMSDDDVESMLQDLIDLDLLAKEREGE